MAQLIKLQDYISRYESDISRYPTQFVRLKKQQWEKLVKAWEENRLTNHYEMEISDDVKKASFIDKVKVWFKKEDEMIVVNDLFDRETEEDEIDTTSLLDAHTKDELKKRYLNQLIQFQIKWASSTLLEKSFVNQRYYDDERLKHFLQRFPDNVLMMYEPVFLIKKAPIDFEVLLITPTEVWCLAFIEHQEDAAYIGNQEHFWTKMVDAQESKVLNPTISASRMEKIVQQILHLAKVEFPIKKAIISRNGYIDYPDAPTDIILLTKRTYDEWFEKLRNNRSPLKMLQVKAANALLDYCHTSSFRRPEWSINNE